MLAATRNSTQISGASHNTDSFFLRHNLIGSSTLLGEDQGSWLLLWPHHLEDGASWSLPKGRRGVKEAHEH